MQPLRESLPTFLVPGSLESVQQLDDEQVNRLMELQRLVSEELDSLRASEEDLLT